LKQTTAGGAVSVATLVAADIPNLDTSKITTGRFGMARMPDGTSGLPLKGAGAGVDPAYGRLTKSGMEITLNKLLLGAGAGADPTEIANTMPTIVRKTADEIVNNSITLQNDDHLFLAMAANEVWFIDLILYYVSATTTPDIVVRAALPTAAIGSQLAWGYSSSDAAYILTAGTGTDAVFGTSSTKRIARITYLIINGANAGNFQIQWRQGTATAEDTTVLTNSFIIAHKLA
jgi:hypothetical protein